MILRRRMMGGANVPSEYYFDTAKEYTISQTGHSGKACQGGCYANDKWYAATILEDSSEQYLYCYDFSAKSWSLLKTYTNLGHANSMTYNPTANVFYVATMDSSAGTAVLDGTTLEKTSSIPTAMLNGDPFNAYAVAYDRTRNLLYYWINDKVIVCDTTGTTLREIALVNYAQHITASQGMETDGKHLFLVWSSFIDVYTISGTFIKSIAFGQDKEHEEIGYDWSGRFYCQKFVGTSTTTQLYLNSLLFMTIDGWAEMAYVPFNVGYKSTTGGTVTYPALYAVQLNSTASQNYNTWALGAGYPFGYGFLEGKTCRVSFTLKRTSGSTGYIGSNIFTTNSQKPVNLSLRLSHRTTAFGSTLALNETLDVSYEFVYGTTTGYTPDSSKQGTYVGYVLFIYANSGVGFEITNYKFEVNIPPS